MAPALIILSYKILWYSTWPDQFQFPNDGRLALGNLTNLNLSKNIVVAAHGTKVNETQFEKDTRQEMNVSSDTSDHRVLEKVFKVINLE